MVFFRLFRIPIQVHFTHFLFSAFLSYYFVHFAKAETRWPGSILSNGDHPSYWPTAIFVFGAWMFFFSASALVQQLGFSFAAKHLGLKPVVRLFGLTGMTLAPGVENLPWHHEILVHGAGPLATLTLGIVGGLFGALFQALHVDGLAYLGSTLLLLNLVITAFAMLPISTSAGGHILSALMTKVFGRRGFLLAQMVSLLACVALIALAFIQRAPLWGLLAGMLFMRTFDLIKAYRRGELPKGEETLPELKTITRAETLFHQGKTAEAELVLSDVNARTSLGKQRTNRLLGLLALQEGRGKEAMERFLECKTIEVPPSAKATALGLIGKDEEALGFWVKASEQHPDSPATYELGGCLIRLGRENEARRIEGMRVAMAYLAAERVHSFRGEFEFAAQASESAFQIELHPKVAFHAACAWARAGKNDSAMRMLVLAGQNGFQDANLAATTPHLAALHEMREFHAWIETIKRAPAS
jgi:tetratricopeptide (TPR) repeat protein